MRRALAALWLTVACTVASAAVDIDALWNFADPAASEARFRKALVGANGDDALVVRTQIACTFSLRGCFDDAYGEFDAIEPALAAAGVEPRVRFWIAQGWQAAALNIGSDLRQAGRPEESLASFREALAAYERTGRQGAIRIARWQVANVLRLAGQADEALAMQLALERDAAAAGAPDPHVYDGLALLHAARAARPLTQSWPETP